MSIQVRKGSAAVEAALVSQFNALRASIAGDLTTEPHADVTSTTGGDFSAPAATAFTVPTTTVDTLAKTIVRANLLSQYMLVHFADAVAHQAVDDTNDATIDLTELASTATQNQTNTRLNLIQTAYNAHLTQSGVHFTNDTTNDDSTTAASDAPTSQALATALTSAFNAHIQAALGGSSLELVEP